MFTLFKTSRTHMFLACRLVAPAPSHVVGPDGVVAVRSQQDLLAGKDGKAVTGAWARVCYVGFLLQARFAWAPAPSPGQAWRGGLAFAAGLARWQLRQGLCWGCK